MIAMLVTRLEKRPDALNYLVVRPATMTELARHALRQWLSESNEQRTVVDIAAGFSTRGLNLAREFPQVQVLEVDLRDVVITKQRRLKIAQDIDVPSNLSWLSADLGVTPLAEVLGGKAVDVVVAEGLTAYFTPEDNTKIAGQIRQSLQPGGIFICDIPWREGMSKLKEAGSMFSRQAGNFLGIMNSDEDMRQMLLKAGYASVEIHHPSRLQQQMGLNMPVIEFSLFAEAKNTIA